MRLQVNGKSVASSIPSPISYLKGFQDAAIVNIILQRENTP